MDYKLILCGNRFYQEIELDVATESFMIGTTKECKIRFNKSRVPMDFVITVELEDTQWVLRCSEGTYFRTVNGNRGPACAPKPGNKLFVCAEGDNQEEKELFRIDFFVDFPIKTKDYDLRINYASRKAFAIGGGQCSVRIKNADIENDDLRIECCGDILQLDSSRCKYGISVNGISMTEKKVTVKNLDFFSVRGYQFFVHNNELYTSNDGSIQTDLPNTAVVYQKNHFCYPKFVKNTRQQFVIPQEEIEILDPKALPQKPEQNILMSLIPSIISMVLVVVVRGSMGSGGSFVIYSAVMMLMGIVTSIITYFSNGKEYRKKVSERETLYREYLAEQEEKVAGLRNKEHSIACQKSPSVDEDIKHVADFDARLFEKKKSHEDYLVVNLGKGVVKTNCPIRYKKHEYLDTEDYLMDYPESIHDKYEYIQDMPVLLNLRETNAVGFVGTRGKLYQMAKNLILNISTEHFYQDVKMFFIIEEEDIAQFLWARWLQNTYIGACTFRNYMYDEDSAKIALEYLYSELSEREAMKNSMLDEMPNMVVFVYRSNRISNHPIMQYVEKAQKLGFTFLFFEEYEEMLNDCCEKRVFLNSEANEGCIQNVEDGEIIQHFSYTHIPRDVASQAALKLGCVYVDEVSLESSLTKNISLFQLLGIMDVQDLDLEERWNNSKIYETMAAPLGVKSSGETVYLDLHEKFHGPHGLVAGTTGSGKSEILQSYVLSMATLFHPYEIGFIIIDFKGGGMANQFRDLPHLNGAITNIDNREIDRSLLSIRAELRKRQELFAEYGVNHIDDYIKLFKQGGTPIPLPHLILIVDEFAELKSEQPDFMKELISTARIGRSLGVHLILATQKPSGVVNDQIWSNSKFKLCLKVQTKEDSNEVIKSPLASEIREPGRAYLQVGNNEIFQLFQSAYSGAPAKVDTLGVQKEYKISKVLLSGQREVIFEQKPKSREDSETQLEALVTYIQSYCDKQGVEKLQDICLPPLEDKIPHTLEEFAGTTTDICVPIGIYDDPSKQSQNITGVNLTTSHLFAMGSAQMGKTNLLQMLVKGIAERYSPSEVNIYILDFASMILKNLEGLKHVGGVITARDDEKLKNLMKMIGQIIVERKEFLSQQGLSSFSAYREAGYRELQQIILMIDNVTAFRELYPSYEDALTTFCREGISVGVTIVATNSQSSGMGFRFLTNFGTRIAFSCNNKNEISNVFDRCKLVPKETPGRAVIQLGKEMYECQTYLAFDAEKEIERMQMMKQFIAERNQFFEKITAAKYIPEIPEVVTKEYIRKEYNVQRQAYEIPMGLDFANTEPVYMSLKKTPLLGIVGKPHFGRGNMVRYMLRLWEQHKDVEPIEVYISDSVDKKLLKYKENSVVAAYSYNPADVSEMIKNVHNQLELRYQMMVEGKDEEVEKQSHLVLLLNAKDVYPIISSDRAAIEMYKKILSQYRTLKVTVMLTDMENVVIGFNSCEVLKFMKENRTLLVFENLGEQKLVETSLSVLKEYKKPLNPGEMYMFINNKMQKIKTPLCEEETMS